MGESLPAGLPLSFRDHGREKKIEEDLKLSSAVAWARRDGTLASEPGKPAIHKNLQSLLKTAQVLNRRPYSPVSERDQDYKGNLDDTDRHAPQNS